MRWFLTRAVVVWLALTLAAPVGAQSGAEMLAVDRVYSEALELASSNKFREALEPAERALVLYEKIHGPDHCALVEPLLFVGNMRRETGDYRGSIEAIRRALAICEREFGEVDMLTSTALNNLGIAYRLLGEYSKAIPLYERAMSIRERVFDSESELVAETGRNLGIIYSVVGDSAAAEPLLVRSLEVTERVFGPDDQHTGLAAGILANFYANTGRRLEAERLYRRAIDIQERVYGIDHRITLISLANFATHYIGTGAYAQAEALLVRALEGRERVLGPDHPDVANSLAHLAVLYLAKGETSRARPLLERALAIHERTTGPGGEGAVQAVLRLGDVEVGERNYGRAEQLYARAVLLNEQRFGPDSPKVGLSLVSLAGSHMARGDLAGARPHLERALAIYERSLGEDHEATVTARSRWADLLWATGRVADAVAVQTRANDARERELVRNLTVGSEQRKLAYLEMTARELDRTIALHQRAAPANPAAARAALEVILRRKGRALDAMARQVEALRRRATPEDRKLLADLSIARAEYARLTLAGPKSGDESAYRAESAALARRIEELETRVADLGAEFRAGALAVTLDAVREGIPDGAVLVEIASFQPFDPKTRRYGARRYTAYTLDRLGAIRFDDLGLADEIDALVTAFRTRLRAGSDERGARAAARALDERVGRPIRRLAGASTQLLVSPDGALNLVPFAALVDEQRRYMVERYTVTYLTSGRDLLKLRPAPASAERREAEVVANPDFGAGAAGASLQFAPLPGTEQEARDISRMLGNAHVLTGPQATEAALKRVAAPEILHVATHGFFLGGETERAVDSRALETWEATREVVQVGSATAPAPGAVLEATRGPLLRSGLGLAGANRGEGDGEDDGLLTAFEAAGLDLWGTKLVVLSACDTGVGEVRAGDGVYGLRRALVLAGSEAQVMSLWAVSDQGTRELMVVYYGELLAGRGRSEALRRTQLALLRDPRRRHPFYWAGFIPSGAWWPIDRK